MNAASASPVPQGAPPTAASLAATPVIDADHPEVKAFAAAHDPCGSDTQRAVALNLAVRDLIRYDPYHCDLSVQGISASTALKRMAGWCVPKAALLAAVLRARGIPARLGYADVRNHMSTERMRVMMGTDLYIWHGYTDIWLEGRWLKATPAFNIQLCERFGLKPLDFDGTADSIYHPFDVAGNRHMEYVQYRGAFDDMPLAQIVADFEVTYPRWLQGQGEIRKADFDEDVRRER